MLVATLIVVPIHFMLAGEMRLLNQVTALRVGRLRPMVWSSLPWCESSAECWRRVRRRGY